MNITFPSLKSEPNCHFTSYTDRVIFVSLNLVINVYYSRGEKYTKIGFISEFRKKEKKSFVIESANILITYLQVVCIR